MSVEEKKIYRRNQIKIRQRKYVKNNKDRVKETNRKQYLKNKEKIKDIYDSGGGREKSSIYYYQNRDVILKKMKIKSLKDKNT
jgi:hypothetical protein